MSFRITVNEEAAAIALAQPSTTIGAMVIRSLKGNAEPILIPKGNNSIITQLFGYPNATYPDIQEALDYNNDSAIRLSAPSDALEALKGGVLIKDTGTVAITQGVPDIDLFDFAQTPTKDNIGTGDDVTLNFNFVLTGTYVEESLSKIVIGSTEIDVAVTDAEPEVITGVGITSGTLTRATKTLDITLDVAPAQDVEVYAIYESDESADTYFAIFSGSAHISDESVKVNYNTDLEQFEWDFYIKDHRKIDKLIDRYVGSIDPDKFNVQNQNIYMETSLADVPYFTTKVNLNVVGAVVDDTSLVPLGGGARGTAFTSVEYAVGWEFFKNQIDHPANIFMDVTGDDSIPALFNTLRTSYQKYKRYIIVLPDNEASATSIATKSGYSIDNRGLSFYSNWMLRKENFTNTKFWSSLIGSTGVKHAEIIRQAFGGLAPSWVNENGLGGQLPITAEKARYSYDDDELRALDSAGINPRVKDFTYGVVITSQKTGQNPVVLTDFSYIGHSGAADYVISETIRQALIPQQTKLNDNTHQTQVRTKSDAILDPLVAKSVLTEFISKCDSENNTAVVKSRREFVLTQAVKYTPTSEFITYNYLSVDQGVSVEEVV